ncbi:nitrilase-related carbon-nitrogen hydrolase [Nocardioides ochotonae]|uniref:nitrilase-related carbon-nitrogen hydrolase n=1 Tax=Nocardioides ochotonae TaxID=2685869 RepID=UPI001A9E884F|nr:nitrilase-related carbon-nitrogen hydrolase [Nocardioides ochotonae]
MSSPRFRALALQTACHAINACPDTASARSAMLAAVDRIHGEVLASRASVGQDLRLVVLPEYVLSGPPMGEALPVWAERAALDPDGPEYQRLAAIAEDAGVFLAVNNYETDEHFPDVYFQACVIFGPTGELLLRYRRLNSMWAVTPHDVLDRYLEIYGEDALFPVADTEIGRLAPIASEEILYPEIARCFAVRGAEIFVHSSSEVASNLQSPKNVAKLARALENSAYVVSANTAGLYGTALPPQSGDGSSKIVDHRGLVLAEAVQGPSMAANAEIDLASLRAFRRRVAMENVLARQRFELYAPTYSQVSVHPANTVEGVPDRAHFRSTQESVIRGLEARGII